MALTWLALSVSMAQAFDVRATPEGISIDAGAAGTYRMTYPRLMTMRNEALNPENITIKPDGSGATMTFTPGGKLTIDKQADGSWTYHMSEIPSDRTKCYLGDILLPGQVSNEGVTWAYDHVSPVTFPKDKGQPILLHGVVKTFVLKKNQAGFVISYPQKTWVDLMDRRAPGKDHFVLGNVFNFPGKKTIPEISYSFKIEEWPIKSGSVAPSTVKYIQAG